MKRIQKYRVLAFVLFGIAVCCGQESTAVSLGLGILLYGNGADENFHTARVAGGYFEADLRHSFLPDLRGHFLGGLQFETGSSQALYTDEYAPKQALKLREAALEWVATHYLNLKAGALNQDFFDSAIVLSNQTFPGLLERGHIDFDKFYADLIAEQSVPTTTFLSDLSSRSQGTFPTFFTERVALGYKPSDALNVEARASHFLFQNLGDQTAYQGRFFGNTVGGMGPNQSFLVYNYQGFHGGLRFSWSATSKVHLALGSDWLINTQGPAGGNQGFDARMQVPILFSQKVKLTPAFEIFRVDSDVVPALYNAKELGHSNRQGYSAGLELELTKDRLLFGGQFTNAGLVTSSLYQADFRYVFVYFRSNYDVL